MFFRKKKANDFSTLKPVFLKSFYFYEALLALGRAAGGAGRGVSG